MTSQYLSPAEIKSRMAEFEKEFPHSEYIWLTPHRVIGGFIERVFSLSPEILEFDPNPDHGDFWWIDKPWSDRPGNVSFVASALQIIATTGGVNWLPNNSEYGTGRVDNRTDPMVCEFTAGGTLIGLSGMKPVIKTARADLHLERDVIVDNLINDAMSDRDKNRQWPVDGEMIPWKNIPPEPKRALAEQRADSGILRMRRFMLEKCETKAQNRVIRHMFGIKSKYSPEEIRGKKWLVLVMRFDPKPANEYESRLLFGALTKTFVSAYPGLPQGDIPIERPMLAAPIDETRALTEPEPAEYVIDNNGETPADAGDDAVTVGDGDGVEHPPAETSRPPAGVDYGTFMTAVQMAKTALADAYGRAVGHGKYYAVLNLYGYDHANDIRGDEIMRGKVYNAIAALVRKIPDTGADDSASNPLSNDGAAYKDSSESARKVGDENTASQSPSGSTDSAGDLFPKGAERESENGDDSAPEPDIWNGRDPLYNADDPAMMFVKLRHESFVRLNEIELINVITESAADYDIKRDLLEIVPLMDSKMHGDLVFVAVKIFMHNTGKLAPKKKKAAGKK